MISLSIRRIPATQSDIVRLGIKVADGPFAGALELWCPVDQVVSLGVALGKLPSRIPDKYEFYFEEEQDTKNVTLRAETVDRAGHLIIEVALVTASATCRLAASVEPAELNQLGDLFLRIGNEPNGDFRWPLEKGSGHGRGVSGNPHGGSHE